MIFNYIFQNWVEITAVVLAILYLVLAVKQNILCWVCGIISSVLYFFIMRSVGLYMEAYLQIFYVFMGFYGWSQWKIKTSNTSNFVVNTWNKSQHLFATSMILMLSIISATMLRFFTDAALPFLDALVTWGAVVATYMVAKKLLENWIYWLVIDSISIFLFISRGLFPTAFLFGIYIIIIIYGYRSWSKKFQEDNALST
ncbi:nicotinamide riboside transporter PnuC [Gammaproteobacteria bacterium]|nr:nicotinamide riboside transporter PnuC [Gammaproteobacteria bacterium]